MYGTTQAVDHVIAECDFTLSLFSQENIGGVRLTCRKPVDNLVANALQVRSFDTDGFRRRAGCVCVSVFDHNQFLVVKSSRQSKLWIFPAGGVEKDEELTDAATRETFEEAGVLGRIVRDLGAFEDHEKRCRTHMFLMLVEETAVNYHDASTRERCWLSIQEITAAIGEFLVLIVIHFKSKFVENKISYF